MDRVEVITSVERRRRYSDEQKLAMLAEAKRTSVARVAAKYEISPSVIYIWKKKLMAECTAVAQQAPAFARVSSEPEAAEPTEHQPIYLHLGGELIVEFPVSVQMESLVGFIQALRG